MVGSLPYLLLALLAPNPGCGFGGQQLVAELNLARLGSGSAPLRTHPTLCRAAAERVAEVERDTATDQDVAAINRRTRSLFRGGYAPHAWIEAAVVGGGPDPPLEQFRVVRPGWHAEALSGHYEEVGAAAGELEGRPVWTLLLGLSKRSVEWRDAAPLEELSWVRAEILAAVNRKRAESGRHDLRLEGRLNAAAQAHARDMLERAFYAHRSPDGTTPRDRARAAGYPDPRTVSENIAKGLFSPAEVVDRWMNSSNHRKNILHRRFSEMGVGVAFGENANGFEVVWVQLFTTG